jgi:hypothetical protein
MSAGRVFVDNEAVLQDLLSDAGNTPGLWRAQKKTKARETNPEVNEQHESRETTRLKNLEHYKELSKRTEMDAKKGIERTLKLKQKKVEKNFDVLTNDIGDAKGLLDSIDESMALQDEAARNKTRRQFEDWNQNVHGKIQGEILQKLDAKGYKQLNKERNADYQNFLDITNRKSAIYRDIIIESEYDPLEPNRRSIKAVTGNMKDPTLMILQKLDEESGTFSKKKQTLGRDSLDVKLWASGQIEATPYGRFNKMMGVAEGGDSDSAAPDANKSKSSTMRSKVKFDHFDYPTDKASLDNEMPKGKRIVEPFRGPAELSVSKASGHPDTGWMF